MTTTVTGAPGAPPEPVSSAPGADDGGPVADAELAGAVNAALVRAQRWLRRAGAVDGPPVPVGHSGLSALATLVRLGPIRPGQLADAEQVTASTMTRVVDGLVTHALVRRVPDPADGRASLLAPTEAGGEVVDRVRAARAAALRERLAELAPADRRALRAALPALAALAGD